jgi:hypothetical protein
MEIIINYMWWTEFDYDYWNDVSWGSSLQLDAVWRTRIQFLEGVGLFSSMIHPYQMSTGSCFADQEAGCSHSSSAKFKNAWKFTFTSLYVFIV